MLTIYRVSHSLLKFWGRRILLVHWLLVTISLTLGTGALATRLAPGADSLQTALNAAEYVLTVQVVEVKRGADAEYSELLVLTNLKGELPDNRITVKSALTSIGQQRPEAIYFKTGESALVLLERRNDHYISISDSTQSKVVWNEDFVSHNQILDLINGYLAIPASGPVDIDKFRAFLKNQITIANEQLRRGVIYDLAKLLRKEDRSFLRQLLADPAVPEGVRVWAIHNVAALCPSDLPSELQELLTQDTSVRIRQIVLNTVGERGSPDDLPLLIRGLQDPDSDVREVAVEAFMIPDIVPILQNHFEQETADNVRIAIIRKLGRIASCEAIKVLKQIGSNATDTSISRETARARAAAESANKADGNCIN